jgi:hypothetical protein
MPAGAVGPGVRDGVGDAVGKAVIVVGRALSDAEAEGEGEADAVVPGTPVQPDKRISSTAVVA